MKAFAIAMLSVVCAVAAEIAVRREGPAFRISGGVSSAEVALYVGEERDTPVLGRFEADGGDLLFHPRFSISASVACHMVVRGRRFDFLASPTVTKPTTSVVQIYPTAEELPANQLKLYLQFSAPMRRDQAWQNLRLLNDHGKPVELAFLEIDQELWDAEGKRLTVLFDPGRIKRGVLPRDAVGGALEMGKVYTLQIDANWHDANNVPLQAGFEKKFRVAAEDRTPIDPSQWKLQLPKAGTKEALVIAFGESLDAALALRLITADVAGQAVLGPSEREWRLVPDAAWKPGAHWVNIDTALEDLAGNKVGRPFDVDTFEKISVRTGRTTVTLPFVVK